MAIIRQAIQWIGEARAHARTRRHLALLDKERLFDLGINRHQALSEASRPFWDWNARHGARMRPAASRAAGARPVAQENGQC